MDRVHTQEQLAITNVGYSAIAIKSVDSDQCHIGILHREGDQVLLLDLAWHCDLRNNPPSSSYLWIKPDVPELRMRQVAARCRQVWRSNEGTLPYALSPPSDCFDVQTGAFLLGPTRHGLTCSSFVLAIFETAGLSLVDYETWPTERPGDQEWQERVVGALENSGTCVSAEHLETVKNEIGAVRYRPEDVAGAATASPLPADFSVAVERARKILELLNAC